MEIRKITKIGDSNLVALPPKFMSKLRIRRGDYINMYLYDDVMILKKPVKTHSPVNGFDNVLHNKHKNKNVRPVKIHKHRSDK